MGSEGVWGARVCGERGCVGSEGVWGARVCGERGCVGSEGVWGVRVCGVRVCGVSPYSPYPADLLHSEAKYIPLPTRPPE